MNLQVLIDSLVQQTTVLIGQLSTAAGIRAPLSRIADQVFLELANELNDQGVPRRVAAGMFGLPLRSYQKKLRRLKGSESQAGKTLWEAVFSFVREEAPVGRARVEARFSRDDQRELGAVINDLVGSGLVTQTGRGNRAVYAPTSEAALRVLREGDGRDKALLQVWLRVHDRPGISESEFLLAFPELAPYFEDALTRLVDDGRIRVEHGAERALHATALNIPVGSEHGWEIAVFDHFRAVVNAISAKVRRGNTVASRSDVNGG